MAGLLATGRAGPTYQRARARERRGRQPDLEVSVTGEHFQPGASLVQWNGSPRPTQSFPGSATLLVVNIASRDLAVPGTALVTVVVVQPEQVVTSRPVGFVVVPAAAAERKDAARSRS